MVLRLRASNTSRASLPLAITALLMASASFAQDADSFSERGYARTDRLVTTAWVESHLGDPDVLIVDLRAREAYDEAHIPGAVHVPPRESFQAEDGRGVPGMLPPRDAVASTLARIGATPATTIVFYDDVRNLWAARALWALAVYRHADVRIMDGAWGLWSAEGRRTSATPADPSPTTYAFENEPDTTIVADWDDVVTAIDDPTQLVCDARSGDEFAGIDVRSNRGGHVPGSVHVEWSRATSPDGRFLDAASLSALYTDAGVTNGRTTFTLCQSGVRAAHTWFVLTDLLGYPDVRVYDGSWVEYGNRDDSPIEDPSAQS